MVSPGPSIFTTVTVTWNTTLFANMTGPSPCMYHGLHFELALDETNYQKIVYEPWSKETKFQSLSCSQPQVPGLTK